MKLKQFFYTLFLLSVLIILTVAPRYVFAAGDIGNDPASAASISVGSPVLETIEIVSDVDYYKFDATAGITYTIGIALGTLDKTNLFLYDTDGTTLIGFDEDIYAPVIAFTCKTPGTYYVKAAGFDSTWGTYTITLATPADDHPNAYEFATAVTVDDATDKIGDIQYLDDMDYFKFDATAGTAYVLTETPGPILYDSDLHLFDTDGITELHSKYEYSMGTAIITWICRVSGTYYASVGGDSGDYTFSVMTTTVTDLHGDDAANATTIIVDGMPPAGNIEFSNDEDYFKFTATAGTIYNIMTSSTTLFYSKTHFFDTDGTTEIASVYGGIGNTSSIAWTCPSNGTYYVMVKGASTLDTQVWTGTYTPTITTVSDDHANNIAGAFSVTVGGSVDGIIQYSGDQDFFKFTATAGTIYTISATIGTVTPGIWILDSAGRKLSDNNYSYHVWGCQTSGTYYYIVEAATFGDTGTYTTSVTSGGVTDDFGNDYTLATGLTINIPVSAQTEYFNDKDFFKFDATTGAIYKIIGAPVEISGVEASLFDTDGTTLIKSDTSGLGFEWTCAKAGTYYVMVRSHLDDIGQYDIQVTNTGSGSDDHGDDPAGATDVVPNSTYPNGNIEVAKDVDYFKFTATAGMFYEIENYLLGSLDMDITLYDLDLNKIIGFDTDNGSNGDQVISWLCPTNGTYYFHAKGTTGGYIIGVTEDDHWDDAALATPILANGLPVDGNIEGSLEPDFFRLDADAGSDYIIWTSLVGTLPLGDSYLVLYDTDGTTQLAADDNSGSGNASQILWTCQSSGTYYVAVSDATESPGGTYTLSIEDDGDGDGYSIGEGDCDDTDPAIYPGATEICEDGIDQDCDGADALCSIDSDGDGYTIGDGDCNDNDASVNPGATEVPDDGVDNNCDGLFANTYYMDSDGDGYGDPGASPVVATSQPAGYVLDNTDCDDTDATINPGAIEIINDGIDQNCDGTDLAAFDDHGNDSTDATAVVVGIPINGDLEYDTDADCFSFDAVAGTIYTIETTLSTLTDSYLMLFDTDGFTEIAFDDNSGTGGFASKILWLCETSGTYYAIVNSLAGDLGTYSLSVDVFKPLITATATDSGFTVDWEANPVPSHLSYIVYIGTISGMLIYDIWNGLDVGNVLTHTETGLLNLTTYFIKVTFIDTLGMEYPYADEIYTTPYPPATSSDKDYTGGPANYNMVSFPVTLTDPDPINNLGPLLNPNPNPDNPELSLGWDPYVYDPAKWRIYIYNSGYVQPPDEVDALFKYTDLQPGRGYWIVGLKNALINLPGDSVDSSSDFFIDVPPGWYMIGNPFNFAVEVAELRVDNGVVVEKLTDGTMTLPNLYYYDGSKYVIVTQIEPNKAYWVKNLTTIIIQVEVPPIVAPITVPAEPIKPAQTDELQPPPPGADISAGAKDGCFIAEAAYDKEDTDVSLVEKIFNIIDYLHEFIK